jgi:hypothetical protein
MARVVSPSVLSSAIACDGSAVTKINCGSSTSYALNAGGTIACWFFCPVGDSHQSAIMGLAIAGNGIQLGFFASSLWLSHYKNSTPITDALFGSVGQFQGVWHLGVVTFDAIATNIYIDGSLVVSRPAGIPVFGATPNLTFGSNYGNGYPLFGRVSKPAIFSSALSLANVQALYAGTAPTTITGLVATWPTTEGSGNLSIVGSGNIGTLGSGASWVTANGRKPISSTRALIPLTQNLLTYSNTFTNAAWAKANTSIGTSIADPFGGNNAFSIIEDDTNGFHYIAQDKLTPGTATYSIYAKAAGRNYLVIQLIGGSSAGFDLTTGATSSSGSVIPTATNAGNGWWRLSLTATLYTTSFNQFAVSSTFTNAPPSYTGTNGLAAVYVYGAQLVNGVQPGPLQITTSAPVNNGGIRSLTPTSRNLI